MKFIEDGPDIPERLLTAHEEGNIVFFCGAGISYPSGLPLFAGLVQGVYETINVTPTETEQSALSSGKYDLSVGLLESRAAGGRQAIRAAIARILGDNIDLGSADTTTHEALLHLARNRNGKLRLVTTNFDRLFEVAQVRLGTSVSSYCAPLLPNPKNSWQGLVYLHGLLPSEGEAGQDSLVVSSGDFGQAYLTERWASRFVSALFSATSMCFVGYSINDPIVRYITDALAADRRQGEPIPEMFALAGCSPETTDSATKEWRAKNVTPLLYNNADRHRALYVTLRKWSDTYKAGVLGRESIINQRSVGSPQPDVERTTINRVIWALNSPNSRPARRFAEMVPPPPLEWLTILSEPVDGEGGSILFPKASPFHASSALLVHYHESERPLSAILVQMGRWLSRHLNNPHLILWVYRSGGVLHSNFARLISARLDEIRKYELEPSCQGLRKLRQESPDGVPDERMRNLWLLAIAGKVRPPQRDTDLLHLVWAEHSAKRDSVARKLFLQRFLEPRIHLESSYYPGGRPFSPRVRIPDAELFFHEFGIDDANAGDVFECITGAMHERFRIACSLGTASEWADHSSIGGHFRSMRAYSSLSRRSLAALALKAWSLLAEADPHRARLQMESCWISRCPLLRSIALVGFCNRSVVPMDVSMTCLLSQNAMSIWLPDVRLALKGYLEDTLTSWTPDQREQLLSHALCGPLLEDITVKHRELEILSALELLSETNFPLNQVAKDTLRDLIGKYPESRESEVLSDPPTAPSVAPHGRKELASWLRRAGDDDSHDDEWADRCANDFQHVSAALLEVAAEDIWPVSHWSRALSTWSDRELSFRAWKTLGAQLADCPDYTLAGIITPLSYLLRNVFDRYGEDDEALLGLCLRILALNITPYKTTPFALHPSFLATLGILIRGVQNPAWPLPEERIFDVLSALCRSRTEWLSPAIGCIARNANFLLHRNRRWSEKHLPPLFSWSNPEDAAPAWQQLLSDTSLSLNIVSIITSDLLESARHYERLGDLKSNYCGYLMRLAMDHADILFVNPAAFRSAIMVLPPQGRVHCVAFLRRCLSEAPDAAHTWHHRVGPLLSALWPGVPDEQEAPEFFLGLAEICIVADDAFESALDQLQGWLLNAPPIRLDVITWRLKESRICARFPERALGFIELVCRSHHSSVRIDLSSLLAEAAEADPAIALSHTYIRLRDRPDS